MRTHPTSHRPTGRVCRRAVLVAGAAAGGVTLAGCSGDEGGQRASGPPARHPLQPVLDGALTLLADYDAAVLRHHKLAKRLDPLRADHRRHVRALTRAIGSPSATASGGASATASATPSTRPVPHSSADTVSALADAERRGQRSAETHCVSAPARYARLIGSIAACRASHVEVLR